MTPEIIMALGGAVAATVGAVLGGKKGGENSLNGFKDEVRQEFQGVHGRLDNLIKTDGRHEAELSEIRKIVDRRIEKEPFVLERRRG